MIGRYEDAIKMANKAISIESDDVAPYVALITSNIFLGHDKEARDAVKKIFKINPKFSIVEFAKRLPYKDQDQVERLIAALRKAGLSE